MDDDKTVADEPIGNLSPNRKDPTINAVPGDLPSAKPFESESSKDNTMGYVNGEVEKATNPTQQNLEQKIRTKMEETEAAGPRIRKDPLIGLVFGGRFEIISKIGAGGMGLVYKAKQKGMDRHVAVKVLLKQNLTNETAVRRFQREALTVSKLEHPNTVRIYDFGEAENGMLYIAMELLIGAPLKRLLDQQRQLPVRQTLRIAQQICRSLHEAHEKGIIHRDLKPDNVFVGTIDGQRDYTKVLDFGLAKLRENADDAGTLTQHGTIFGTPKYMSPEQCRSEAVGATSDLYSLGIMMFEMLVGQVPFQAENPLAILIQHTQDPVPPLPDVRPDLLIPIEVEQLLRCLLDKSSENRLQTAKEVSQRCSELLEGLPESFEEVITLDTAKSVGLKVDRSTAYTVPGSTPISALQQERIKRTAKADQQTIGLPAPELTAKAGGSAWKRVFLALVGVVLIAGAGGLIAVNQVEAIPETSRHLFPESEVWASAPLPVPEMISVSVEANVPNVMLFDGSTEQRVGAIPNANERVALQWLREPGRVVSLQFRDGTNAPQNVEVDLGGDMDIPKVTFSTDASPMVELSVTTNVGGAFIRAEGIDTAWTTPDGPQATVVLKLPQDDTPLVFHFEKPGYLSQDYTFVPVGNSAVQIELAVDPASTVMEMVALTVTTDVGGVFIRIEGMDTLWQTGDEANAPRVISLPQGETPLTLHFEKAGYLPQTQVYSPSEPGNVAVTMAPDPSQQVIETVELTVHTNIGGVFVRIEGTENAWTTPEDVSQGRAIPVPKGDSPLTVHFEKPGYIPATRTVLPSEPRALRVDLEVQASTAVTIKLTVKVNVSRVDVTSLSNNQLYRIRRRNEPLIIDMPLSEDATELRFERRGYESQTVTVTPNADQEVAVQLKRRARVGTGGGTGTGASSGSGTGGEVPRLDHVRRPGKLNRIKRF